LWRNPLRSWRSSQVHPTGRGRLGRLGAHSEFQEEVSDGPSTVRFGSGAVGCQFAAPVPWILCGDGSAGGGVSTGKSKYRGIASAFETALETGVLAPILEQLRECRGKAWKELDETLCLDVRHNEVTVYYRGAALFTLAPDPSGGFTAKTHDKYRKFLPATAPFQEQVHTLAHCRALVAQVPLLKAGVDAKMARSPSREREIQQEIIRCNNRGKSGRSSDIFFCDQEYAVSGMRADLVGVLWPSDASRRRDGGHRLVWAELKQGDGAIGGRAGIQKHLQDLDKLLGDPSRLSAIQREMAAVFNLKQRLGLVNCGKPLDPERAFDSPEKPLVLLILVDHDPAKSGLGAELQGASMQHAEVRIPRASTMGYALFENELLSVADLMALDRAWRGGGMP